MNKKILALLIAGVTIATTTVFAAKYTISKSGTVKNQAGQTITSPANSVNQNYFNNYTAANYVNNNVVNENPVGMIEIVMDFSGSMSNWITVAKRSMTAIVAQIPSSTQIGFRVFGHDSDGSNPTSIHTLQDVKKIVKNGNKFTVVTERSPLGTTRGACSATKQVAPIISANSNSILYGMNSVDIGGATPLVYALDRAAYQDFANYDTVTPKKIVLITDGGENCGGDPCAFARSLMRKRSDIHIDVVFVSSYSKSLSCLASTTGGHLYNVDNLGDFTTTMTRTSQSKPATQQEIKKQSYEFIAE
jgi:hypothetical protein